ncbi:class I SAM-dependent methyltransferase [Streptomyces sp. SID13031]|uniref:class I SAM-dependent methyltransferase n=1 Tax=Streptomyces sp. SID13031 TaxID=2706046 RepID=UPI001944C33D|nr:class I SAM-dependent methyltransferase [Streptomyces sp. SID13031]
MGFGGEVAGFYQRYRRGYPAEVIDGLVSAFELTRDDVVVDLGCGTGQLALPLAERVRAVIGMDPEPDMLAEARRVAADRSNLSWMVGSDADVSVLGALLGKECLGAVTIGQALHWMDHDTLFHALHPLLRAGGGVAVVTNGTPLWLQDSDWSRALRRHLELWLDSEVTATCGTDPDSRTRYAESLSAAGFTVNQRQFHYTDVLDLDHIIGGVYSALPVNLLPPLDQRSYFAKQVGRALEGHAPFDERIDVTLLTGTRSARG